MADVKKKKTSKKETIVEEEDKRVIVFIVLAVLVIIAISICLLVGCDKEEDNDNDIINTPNEIDKKDEEKNEEKDVVVDYEEDEGIKVVKTNTSSKKYQVTFKLDDKTIIKKVKKGDKVSKYLPKGYTCEYFENKDLTKKYNFNKKITSDIKIYMSCKEIEYTLIYDAETDNQKNYFISDGDVKLDIPTNTIIEENGTKKVFYSWSLEKDKLVDATYIDESIIDYANENNEIYIYAFYKSDIKLTYVVNGNSDSKEIKAAEKTIIETARCETNTFLGWSTNNDNTIKYNAGDEIEFFEDTTLYAVCASTKVEYTSEEEKIEVGYTEEELENYVTPTPEELELEIPTYYVPVTDETDETKKVVSDDTLEMLENQIKQSDAAKDAAEGYTPEVDDIILEVEKEFTGWEKEVPSEVEGEEPKKEKVEADYKPEKDSSEKLEATWEEPIKYEGKLIDNSQQNEEEI